VCVCVFRLEFCCVGELRVASVLFFLFLLWEIGNAAFVFFFFFFFVICFCLVVLLFILSFWGARGFRLWGANPPFSPSYPNCLLFQGYASSLIICLLLLHSICCSLFCFSAIPLLQDLLLNLPPAIPRVLL
jgi:hypothetical protein